MKHLDIAPHQTPNTQRAGDCLKALRTLILRAFVILHIILQLPWGPMGSQPGFNGRLIQQDAPTNLDRTAIPKAVEVGREPVCDHASTDRWVLLAHLVQADQGGERRGGGRHGIPPVR
jgi:hypothetical protein